MYQTFILQLVPRVSKPSYTFFPDYVPQVLNFLIFWGQHIPCLVGAISILVLVYVNMAKSRRPGKIEFFAQNTHTQQEQPLFLVPEIENIKDNIIHEKQCLPMKIQCLHYIKYSCLYFILILGLRVTGHSESKIYYFS